MVKTLNLNVSFKNKKELITCERREISKEISSRFGINLDGFTMFVVDKNGEREVSLEDISDLMRIKIVPKRKGQQINFINSTAYEMVDGIIRKLKQNSTLSGHERQLLIEALETHSISIFKKQKLDNNQPTEKNATVNKKIQVNIFATNTKESFAQTDPFKIPENNVNNREDPAQELKRLWNLENKPLKEIDDLMMKTFNERRSYICLKCPPVCVVKELYPALFCVEQVKNELDRIFYPGKCREFLKNMHKYCKYILSYADTDDLNEKIKKAIGLARTPNQKTYAEVVGSIFLLAKLLEEDFGFIHLSDYPHGSREVYPHIDASSHSLDEVFFDEVPFHVVVEGQEFCEVSNFPEAILCLMASFFITNIHYPKNCSRTLTVIEKLYLKANDTTDMDDQTVQMIKILDIWAKEDKVVTKNVQFKS